MRFRYYRHSCHLDFKIAQDACFFCRFPPAAIQAAGVTMLPEQAQGPGIALPSPADKVCFMYLLDDPGAAKLSTANHGNGSTSHTESTDKLDLTASAHGGSKQTCSLLVFCQLPLQPERATSWMQGLLQVVQAQHVLVIATLPVSLPPCVHCKTCPWSLSNDPVWAWTSIAEAEAGPFGYSWTIVV